MKNLFFKPLLDGVSQGRLYILNNTWRKMGMGKVLSHAPLPPIALSTIITSAAFILFWAGVIYFKLTDFAAFKGEIHNQVFSRPVADVMTYALPAVWLFIMVLLVYQATRLAGMVLNFLMMLAFTLYVGLALLNAYSRMPCSCAGLFGFGWTAQLYFNLCVTAVAAMGLILTFKEQERRKQGMDAIVSHAPLTG